jgi:hypothetical protein
MYLLRRGSITNPDTEWHTFDYAKPDPDSHCDGE